MGLAIKGAKPLLPRLWLTGGPFQASLPFDGRENLRPFAEIGEFHPPSFCLFNQFRLESKLPFTFFGD